MKDLWKILKESVQGFFRGFGSNRPVAAIIRLLADLPDSRDSIPERLSLNTEDGCCPVCGESFAERHSGPDHREPEDDYVLCKDCFTPHHRQCFDWNGKCAQYACGGRQVHRLSSLRSHFPVNYSEMSS